MTRRGFWFLATAGGALVVSVGLPAQYSASLVSLAALLWYGFLWTLLRLQRDWVVRRLRVTRWVEGEKVELGHSPPTLWENQVATIWVKLEQTGWGRLPALTLVDRVPSRVLVRGNPSTMWSPYFAEPIAIGYQIRPRGPGRIRFEGVEAELTDVAGFFRMRVFLRSGEEAVVYPNLVLEPRGRVIVKKEHLLLGAGVHRHARSGSGSELLALRDYVIGDPPKRIAWRISARRGKLTTKEFERDVPIRSVLFLDLSSVVRVGWPWGTPLHEGVRFAAALSRHLNEKRDPVGLCLVDDDGLSWIAPGVGPRHQSRLLRALCEVAASPPAPTFCPPDRLLEPARDACARLYPELFEPQLARGYSWRDHWGSWLGRLAFPGLFLGGVLWGLLKTLSPQSFDVILLVALVAAACGAALLWIGTRFWMGRRSTAMSFKQMRQRREIARVVSAVQHLGTGGVSILMSHDDTFSREVQQFLIDHDVPYARPLHDDAGRYVYAKSAKAEHLARGLLRAVSLAKDNEFYVVWVDLFEVENIDPVMEAVKVARGRRHQVVWVSPWPAELDEPDTQRRDHPSSEKSPEREAPGTNEWIDHYFRAHERLARRLGELGVPLITMQERGSMARLLEKVEMLRSAQRKPRTALPDASSGAGRFQAP